MDRVSTLLEQFPGPVRLRPSRGKWFALLALGAAFTAAGIVKNSWIGAAFFGLGTLAAAFVMFIGGFEMTLDGDGFSWRAARLFERWRWVDVGDFAVVEYVAAMPGASLRKRVGFNDRRSDKTRSQRTGELLSDVLTGRDCSIPDNSGFSSFGLPIEDLARLMSQWQERALARHVRRTGGH